MVTVLVLALVIRISGKVEFGAWLADQLVAPRHKPPVELVQRSGPS